MDAGKPAVGINLGPEFGHASAELRGLVQHLIANGTAAPAATLSDIRSIVAADGIFISADGELLYPQDRTHLVIELDELIERQRKSAKAPKPSASRPRVRQKQSPPARAAESETPDPPRGHTKPRKTGSIRCAEMNRSKVRSRTPGRLPIRTHAHEGIAPRLAYAWVYSERIPAPHRRYERRQCFPVRSPQWCPRGRPDLAGTAALQQVRAPKLLIVGGLDEQVLQRNERSFAELTHCERRIEMVAGVTHLFEEPGALEQVARLAGRRLSTHLKAARPDSETLPGPFSGSD